MHIINCTPHAVRIYDPSGTRVIWEIPASGSVVRVSTPPQSDAGVLEISRLHGDGAQCSGSISTGTPAEREELRARFNSGPPDAECPLVSAPDFAMGTVTGLPEWARNSYDDGYPYALLVGQMGAEAVSKAWGSAGPVLATDTGPQSVVRDAKGNILGVRRLILVSRGE